jgi:hypothetical protein
VKLVDAADLKSATARCAGSSPALNTIHFKFQRIMMATKDIKEFLFHETGIAVSQWKRLSKHTQQDGLILRVFQDKISENTLNTLEDQQGNISLVKSPSTITPKNNIKTIGYYEFDEEQFSVALVTKEFWEENECLCDSGSEEEFVPKGFYALTDAIYEHDYSTYEQACEALHKAGWIKKNLFHNE